MTCEHCGDAPSQRGPTIVKDQADALALLGRARSGRKVIHGSLRIESSALSPSERERWRERISALANDCGCGVGGAFALIATGAYVVAIFVLDFAATWSGSRLAGIGAIVLFAAAFLGKIAGLLLSRRRLRDLLRGLVVTLGPHATSLEALTRPAA
jgi:hypothetical protein